MKRTYYKEYLSGVLKKWITETNEGEQTQKCEIMFPITPTDPSTYLISSVAFFQLDFEYTVFPLS